ncbi:MAG: UDP-2,3-diacylglucosamine diphosphatase LpxI [Elusimicrobia bacterium]|nr:UDP-2,3-diacylglucosamine diphosphatase LpxI [Elusimicrobiota bacterium]MDD7501541.1 UDP-2,3-diacylglucosamine diphosphatase LpxI [Elusimicrobiota bacterium]MDY5729098.1 UDP-2,3-diacylglucosamine diphosphatase LpxI [Elusimicrobiaceae bacterium]
MTNKIGLIAGEGKMPIYIAQKAAAKGYEVFVAGAKGNAKEDDFKNCARVFQSFRLGQLGAGIRFFKEHGVTRVIMAGRVQHTSIFSNLMPDLRGAKFLASLKNMQTKNILSRVMDEFKKDGIEFEHSALFLEDFMPQKGVLSARQPTAEEQQAAEFGYKIAKAIAALDIGLTCVVSQNAVIAVEGMEGTDRCILRAGELYRESAEKKSSVAVVKVARPNQDNRFDLPVIGKGTLESLHKAGFGLLAFEAGKTLVLDLEDVVALADKYKICLMGI